MAYTKYTHMETARGLEKDVWLIVRGGEILDCILSDEEAINFLASDGDEIVQYTIKI